MKYFRFARAGAIASALGLMLIAAPAFAAMDAYLDFNSTGSQSELPVEKVNAPKTTEIPITNFSFGPGKDILIPNGESTDKVLKKPAMAGTLTVTLATSAKSGELLLLAAKGQPLTGVRLIEYVKGGADGKLTPAYAALLKNVLISSAKWKGSKDTPTESLTLNYGSLELVKYVTKIPPGGLKPLGGPQGKATPTPAPVTGGWNRVENSSDLNVPPT